ncbi:MAG: diaminopimelate epimerase, partial [Candidatus Zixiibacteriota bacterium]
MKIKYAKYHALGNDFLVIETINNKISRSQLSRLAVSICNRRTGVGADGIINLSASRQADKKFDIVNADGSWAEKSGNGLRIAGLHLSAGSRRREFVFETVTS